MAKSEAPQCCDGPMTPIVYGMPGPELMEAVELGGCCLSDDLPMFRCDRCGKAAGRLGDVWDEQFADDT